MLQRFLVPTSTGRNLLLYLLHEEKSFDPVNVRRLVLGKLSKKCPMQVQQAREEHVEAGLQVGDVLAVLEFFSFLVLFWCLLLKPQKGIHRHPKISPPRAPSGSSASGLERFEGRHRDLPRARGSGAALPFVSPRGSPWIVNPLI